MFAQKMILHVDKFWRFKHCTYCLIFFFLPFFRGGGRRRHGLSARLKHTLHSAQTSIDCAPTFTLPPAAQSLLAFVSSLAGGDVCEYMGPAGTPRWRAHISCRPARLLSPRTAPRVSTAHLLLMPVSTRAGCEHTPWRVMTSVWRRRKGRVLNSKFILLTFILLTKSTSCSLLLCFDISTRASPLRAPPSSLNFS